MSAETVGSERFQCPLSEQALQGRVGAVLIAAILSRRLGAPRFVAYRLRLPWRAWQHYELLRPPHPPIFRRDISAASIRAALRLLNSRESAQK
jgi:hypothetical protein